MSLADIWINLWKVVVRDASRKLSKSKGLACNLHLVGVNDFFAPPIRSLKVVMIGLPKPRVTGVFPQIDNSVHHTATSVPPCLTLI